SGIELVAGGARLALERLGAGVTLIRLTGHDVGQFGDAPFAELGADLSRHRHLEVFIDARAAQNASGPVAGQWGTWIYANRAVLRRVSVLVASPYVELTAELVRLFSRVEDLVRLYTDADAFGRAVATACGRPFVLEPTDG